MVRSVSSGMYCCSLLYKTQFISLYLLDMDAVDVIVACGLRQREFSSLQCSVLKMTTGVVRRTPGLIRTVDAYAAREVLC